MVDDKTIADLTLAYGLASGSPTASDVPAAPQSLLEIISDSKTNLGHCKSVLEQARAGKLASALVPLASVSLIAPIPRPLKNVFCVGSNYRAHITEASRAQEIKDKVPEHPVFFTKPPTAVIGPGDEIRLDPGVSRKMDYEVELGVVIGKPGRNIAAADAANHIFGFTILNDITARDVQRQHGGQFLKGKGLDTSCPMGPQIVTIDELGDFTNLRISLSVNDELRQDGNTGNMIFPITRLLESLSQGMTLEPGDLLATGTPSGVGYAMDPPNYLKGGDKVTCEIEGIGELTNIVRDVGEASFAA